MDIHRLLQQPGIEHKIISMVGKITAFRNLHGGSDRTFFRLIGTKGRSLILLYDNNSRRLDRVAQISKYLNKIANLAPKIYENYWEYRLVLMEDLGDLPLEDYVKITDDKFEVYRDVIDMLLLIQSSIYRVEAPVIVKKSVFDYECLLLESQHFLEHFVQRYLKLNVENIGGLHNDFDKLALEIAEQPRVFMHRDFQSKNILFHEERYKCIDNQEGCIGPYSYDLAALLADPYTMLENEMIDKLLDYYIENIVQLRFLELDKDFIKRDFRRSVVSRLLQAIGAFARLTLEGKDEFERYIEPGFSRLISFTDREEFPSLFELLKKLSPEIIK